MRRSPQERLLHALSIPLAAAPFAFALIRGVRTGNDLRYLWVAFAALLGAMAVMTAGRAYSRTPQVAVALSAGAFVVATLLAVLAASLLGTMVGAGLLVVGSAFGFCFAAGCLLHVLGRPRTAAAIASRL